VVIGGATGFPLMMAILIEQPEVEGNPLFQNLWLRFMQWEKFEEILRPYLAEHDWEDLLTRAQELRIPLAAVLDAKTLLDNQHLRERGFFAEVEHPELGKLRLAAHPFKMSETPLLVGRSPLLGEQTHEVLGELGYEAEDQLVLRERGVT
jgi:formyl-CoA transferase